MAGITAINHFKDSWTKQGWEDSNLSAWADRKKPITGRAILVGKQSGTMRRSFTKKTTNKSVIITNTRSFAQVHNRGLGDMTKRQFMGKSEAMNKKIKQKNAILLKKLFS